jgi:hypothetical protein
VFWVSHFFYFIFYIKQKISYHLFFIYLSIFALEKAGKASRKGLATVVPQTNLSVKVANGTCINTSNLGMELKESSIQLASPV